MNSRLIEDRTRQWAQRLLAETSLTDEARIKTLYERAYSRAPKPEEVARAIAFVQRVEAAGVEQKLSATDAKLQAWQSLCRVVLASSEFVYVE
jgi:hypothetical protein